MGELLPSKGLWGCRNSYINTRIVNESLLLKWFWKLYNKEAEDPCCMLLRAKYLKNKCLALSNGVKGSQFWKGVKKIRSKFKWGATFKFVNGRNILFWEDVWVGNIPLRLEFPKLYEWCYNKKCLVSDCWMDGEWQIDFCRPFGQEEIQQWEALLQQIEKEKISSTGDQVKWAFERRGGIYTTQSMYRFLSCRGVTNKRMKLLWGSKLPMKIKVFMWLTFQDRLPSGEVLKHRKWRGDGNCVVCQVPETADHIFFSCPLARSHGYVRKKLWGGIEHLYLCKTCLLNGCPWARRTIASNCTLPQGCFGFCGISVIKWLLRGPSLGILLMYSLKLILLCSVGGCSFENQTRRPLMDGGPRRKGGMGSS